MFTRQRVVVEFRTVECSSPIQIHRCLRSMYGEDAIDVSSDAGSVILRLVKRTLVTGPAAADQPWQGRRRPKTSFMP
jgi:hypothetical protein